MKKPIVWLLFAVAACLLMGNLPAATMNSVTCGTWLPEVNGETTVAADQVQLQAVQIEEDIGAAVRSNVLAVVGQNAMAPEMTLQNEITKMKINEVKSTGSGACLIT